MNKQATGSSLHRRDAILRLLRESPVPSQDALRDRLKALGFRVTQPTLSRDIRELGLVKGAEGYLSPLPQEPTAASPGHVADSLRKNREEKLNRALREFVLSVERVGAFLVVKTPPAAANPLARAIDEAAPEGWVGTIAGDDTIFLLARSQRAATSLQSRLLSPVEPHPRRKQ